MTTLNLNKGEGDSLWTTDNYTILNSKQDSIGYEIINRNTGQVEIMVDQEPPAIMAMLYLEEAYQRIMADPMAEYKSRKADTQPQSSMFQ